MLRFTFRNVQRTSHPITYPRLLHSSPIACKTLTNKVSETADKVNKKVGEGLASAIETGEKMTQSAKESMSSMTEESKNKAEQVTKEAKEKSEKLAEETREAKQNVEHQLRK